MSATDAQPDGCPNPSLGSQERVALLVAAVLQYESLGLHPIRVYGLTTGAEGKRVCKCQHGAECRSPGKHPVGNGWQTETFNVQAKARLLEHVGRGGNIGLRMGRQPDGKCLAALDVDRPELFAPLKARLGELPDTLVNFSGKGWHGVHSVTPDVLAKLSNNNRKSDGCGYDIRSEGGQIVAGPSAHYSGASYEMIVMPIAPLPQAWIDYLLSLESEAKSNAAPRGEPTGEATDTLLFHMYDAAMKADPSLCLEVGDELDGGIKVCVRCFTGHDSEGGDYRDNVVCSKTVIFADTNGGPGSYVCQGASHAKLTTADAMAWLVKRSLAAKAVLDAHDAEKSRRLEAQLNAAGFGEDPAPGKSEAGPVGTSPSAKIIPQDQGCDPTVNEIIVRLSTPSVGVFQRGGKLCTITRDASDVGDVIRPLGTPTIRDLVPARLREIIRTTCSSRDVPLAAEVLARGEWSYIRPLDAIVTFPIVRRDGTLLLTNGYDAQTRTLAEIDVHVEVPAEPTQADAMTALATLSDLVSDFPFVSEGQRSAWLAMLLTVPARPAIDGPTPLGLLEASQRGSGKTLLADLISVIATGRAAPRRVAPKTKEEWDKTMLATLLAGDPVVLIDNVTSMLASDALDAVLTGTTYTQRVLGVSEERRVAIRTVFLASSNNARLSSDLVRRSIACRLEPQVERPEARTDFRRPDLLAYARTNRAALLGAALTVLRAYMVAGRPRVTARPMGSYDAWCRVVRDALVWAGGTDPAVTQDALRESADVENDELRELLTAWHALLGDAPTTVRGLLEAAQQPYSEPTATLLDALRGITPNGGEPAPHTLGNRLRTLRGQIVGGLLLREGKRDNRNTATWQVVRC